MMAQGESNGAVEFLQGLLCIFWTHCTLASGYAVADTACIEAASPIVFESVHSSHPHTNKLPRLGRIRTGESTHCASCRCSFTVNFARAERESPSVLDVPKKTIRPLDGSRKPELAVGLTTSYHGYVGQRAKPSVNGRTKKKFALVGSCESRQTQILARFSIAPREKFFLVIFTNSETCLARWAVVNYSTVIVSITQVLQRQRGPRVRPRRGHPLPNPATAWIGGTALTKTGFRNKSNPCNSQRFTNLVFQIRREGILSGFAQ